MLINKKYDEVRKYALKLPLYLTKDKKYSTGKRIGEGDAYVLMDLQYDAIRGITLEDDKSNVFDLIP